MMKRSALFAAAGLMLLTAHSAVAGDATYTINITGYVPVICNVQVSAGTVNLTGATSYNLGAMTEFCNNPMGYQVWADYTPGLQSTSMLVDGRSVPLSSTGSTMISGSGTAAKLVHNLTLQVGSGDQLNAISMRIVPL